jgi:hypothetical protein
VFVAVETGVNDGVAAAVLVRVGVAVLVGVFVDELVGVFEGARRAAEVAVRATDFVAVFAAATTEAVTRAFAVAVNAAVRVAVFAVRAATVFAAETVAVFWDAAFVAVCTADRVAARFEVADGEFAAASIGSDASPSPVGSIENAPKTNATINNGAANRRIMLSPDISITEHSWSIRKWDC